ncbi:membrane protein [Marmoricola endophyticus]|uniref:Membrane protein n=1 Tax=Marmoricola endophyticus TaxID=2040280 RepID=A0A917F4C8_9ACTN|nr:PH domain-containing protein [Marmoricola endophyticus]GGF45045.1 membrane protein [Marmoricola endophyticus]
MSAEGPSGPVDPPPAADGDLRRLSPLTPLARSGIFLVVVVFAGGREVVQEGDLRIVLGLLVLVLLAGAVFGGLSWYRTFFRITADELRIDTGLLNRRSRRVRLDRILEIGVDQPLVARVLGLAELRIETATNESEVRLAYLSEADAHEVRRTLLARRDRARDEEEAAEPSTEAPARLLVRVPVSWQLVGVLLSPETIGLVVVVLVVVGLLIGGIPFGAFGVGVLSLLGAAVSLGRKASDWWDWTVSAVPSGLQVRHGLFGVSTRTFNVERLQGVRIVEPVLHRPFGLARLELSVAGGGVKESDEDSTGVALPVAPRHLVRRMAEDLIGARPGDLGRVATTLPPRRAGWLAPISRRWLGFGVSEDLVVGRSGWFARQTDVVPLARVQSFRATQGPLQRVLDVATVHADTPVGLVAVAGPHREPAQARRLVLEGADRARVARGGLGSRVTADTIERLSSETVRD